MLTNARRGEIEKAQAETYASMGGAPFVDNLGISHPQPRRGMLPEEAHRKELLDELNRLYAGIGDVVRALESPGGEPDAARRLRGLLP